MFYPFLLFVVSTSQIVHWNKYLSSCYASDAIFLNVCTALYRSRFSHILIGRFIQRLSVYAHEMDNFQRHVDFGLSVHESVSYFGKKKNPIGNNFWSTRHRDFIFGMNNMTLFQKWKGSNQGQWILVWPWFFLWYLRYIGLCSIDHMNNIIHV